MKWSTLQQHKEAAMLCEESMTTIEAKIALLISQSIKQATLTKTQNSIGKTNKHYTNFGMMNHNVETCKEKKEQTMMTTTKAT